MPVFVIFQPGGLAVSVIPAAKPSFWLTLLSDLSSLLIPYKSAFLSFLFYISCGISVLQNSHRIKILLNPSGTSSQGSGKFGTVDRESQTGHILYATGKPCPTKMKNAGSTPFLGKAAPRVSLCQLFGWAHRCVMQGRTAEI